jgi:hypothetical protein
MRARFLLVGLLALGVGCGGSSKKIVPVTGKVTLNGKPLVGASVQFQPVVPEGAPEEISSGAKTDDNGEFTLNTTTGQPGAQVGPHKVTITLAESPAGPTGDERRPVRGGSTGQPAPEFKVNTTVDFEVPPGGTNAANFDVKPR